MNNGAREKTRVLLFMILKDKEIFGSCEILINKIWHIHTFNHFFFLHFQIPAYEARRKRNIDEKNQLFDSLKLKSKKEALKQKKNLPKLPKKAKISVEIRKSSRKTNKANYNENEKENIAPSKKVAKRPIKTPEVHEKENPNLPENLPGNLPGNLPENISGNHQFACPTCTKSFTTKIRLERHDDAVHKGLKPFGCLYCTQTFSTLEIAKQHSSAVHEEVKAFECIHCSTFFATKFNRDDHISTVHEGKLPFQCPVCEKPFGLKSNMTKHVPTHSTEKTFMCPKLECKSSFKSLKGLNRHLKENCKK